VALQHGLSNVFLHFLVEHQDGRTLLVQSTTACSPTHLDILSSSQPTRFFTIKLFNVCKDHGSGGHVETHRECFSGEEYLQQSFLEKQLNYFFDEGQETAVMDSNSFLYNFPHCLDSWQLAILFFQHKERSTVDQLNSLLLCLGCKIILSADRPCIRLHVLFAETENDDWV
jgi:hypothetical protein